LINVEHAGEKLYCKRITMQENEKVSLMKQNLSLVCHISTMEISISCLNKETV